MALRAALGARFQLDPARIVCGAGSDELIQLLMRAYAGPGDEVLYSAHGFLMYKLGALGVGAMPVAAPEREAARRRRRAARLPHAAARACCSSPTPTTRPAAIFRPTSSRACTPACPSDVLLVIDAAYAEYARRERLHAPASSWSTAPPTW